jgi:ASPIC and UnbV/FG-GAP-like repeat
MQLIIRLIFGSFFFIGAFSICSCNRNKTLFEHISSEHSGIHFNNQIIENDSINPLELTNIYNGGGVGIGDFNRDGLPDIYFTGNTVSNKLYLNRGDFKFDDVTSVAGVEGQGQWSRGVSVVDINNDGWPDIYVCATIKTNPLQRRNLLYINQGLDKEGIPHFKEMGKEYGLDDTLFSTMAAFFDYDNDGDLDMYLVVNNIPKGYNASQFKPIVTDGSFPSTGKLFRNDWNDSLKHPVFTDVSKQAGITIEGLGHDVTITDINLDGWKDIYVSNDFIGDDILYINNHDGTFTNKVKSYFKHTSANGMGQDVEDINNDGLADVVELDMDPPDNYRKKLFQGPNNYRNYQNTDYFGYQYQYPRNSLQLNQGPRVNANDSIGDPIFSEIGYYGGIEATDWSWTPLVADFDNDGFRDIIVTNGYPKDVNDHDFINFRSKATNIASKKIILDQIPQIKIHSFAFRNNGDLTFTDESKSWGMMTPSFSNGAAYADLDNDGDLDLIVNNIDDEAHIYRNMSRERDSANHHFLQIQFIGDSLNKNGLGTWVELHYGNGKKQVYENTPYRGYLSTIQSIAHFGLGNTSSIDSLIIKWPDHRMQVLQNVEVNQVLKVDIRNANLNYSFEKEILAKAALFKEITDSVGIHFVQEERDYIDFNIQKMLPHKFSEYGPSIAVGDIDGNGLDDMVVGGSAFHSAQIFLQQPGGQFIQSALLTEAISKNKLADDLQVLLFDANGDGKPDLYIAAGGYENERNSSAYKDQLYINDGKGNFKLDSSALPQDNFTSKFCVRAADYNKDGKLDLFISGRVDPENYPKAVSSFIYRNDSKDGRVKFTDVTTSVAKDLTNIGMVCDALWTDFDNDGWPDLILGGEWMPVTFLRNDHGIFKNVTETTGTGNQFGWWNSIVAGDFDNDGKMDYVVGNLGKNSFYRGSNQYPVHVYAKDFDKNGIYDMIPSLYLPDGNGEMKEFPAQGRDDMLRQINAMRKKFPTYKSYASADMSQVLTEEERKDALILSANNFQSCLFHNEGNGKFTLIPLPAQAQFSAINGMIAEDFDGDGNLDLVVNANDYGTEPNVGRYDALNGLFLKGGGKNNFKPETILQSGIFIPGNGKALVKLQGANGKCLLAAGQNRGPLKIFELKNEIKIIRVQPTDVSANIKYKNGTIRKEEFHYGSSFLSESGRFLNFDKNVISVEITDINGNKRYERIF